MSAWPDRAGASRLPVLGVPAVPVHRGPAAPEAVQVEITVDLDRHLFDAFVSVPMSLHDLLRSLPAPAEPVLGWIPNVSLNGVGLSFDPDPAKESFAVYATGGMAGSATSSADVFVATVPIGPAGPALVVGVRLDSTVDLGTTPLLGSLLSGISIQGLQLSYATADIPEGAVSLPGPGARRLPARRAGLQLSFTVVAGGVETPFVLTPSSFDSATNSGAGAGAGIGAAPVQWFAVQKSFGPLTLGRVGVIATTDRFGLVLDASVNTAALGLVLDEFTVAFDSGGISASGAHLDLAGLGVRFAAGQVSLSGLLVRTGTGDSASYDGSVLVRAGRYGITAVGSYASADGSPSLFVFGLAQGAFGGPPAFFVTGIAAGFGYHRDLRLPAPEQTGDFPLVLAARAGTSYAPDAAAALNKLAAGGWVPPAVGSYWLAAGVRATSFRVVDSFVLLTAQHDRDELVFALLGVASLQLPRSGIGTPYTYAEMVLVAVLRPDAGTVQVTALLTPNSFVLDRACRLSGGFAFYLWFSPERRGDFVVTLGGYHPMFDKPGHYPVVPRLAVDWNISTALHLSGSAYFALTPSCVMAGGALALAFRSGGLAAWFTAHADFLMCWRPFFFDVRIGVSIGASYTLDVGAIHKTFNAELVAEIELWGPPLTGVARVNWWVISFTIEINGGGRPHLPGLVIKDWATFAGTFLPAAHEVCQIRATSGLLGSVAGDGDPVWLVAGSELVLAAETAVPATSIVVGADGTRQTPFDGPPVGVYPMGSLTIGSDHRLELWRVEDCGATPVDVGDWSWSARTDRLPESLWGTVNDGDPRPGAVLVDALVGVEGAPPPPSLTGPPPVSLEVLGYASLGPAGLPLSHAAPIDGSTAPPTVDTRTVVAQTVMSPGVVATRSAVVAMLNRVRAGHGLVAGDLTVLSQQVGRTFPAALMLGPPDTTGPRRAKAPAADPPAAERPAAGAGGPTAGGVEGAAPPPAVLSAAFRRYEVASVPGRPPLARAIAHVFDGFASTLDRGVLAGLLVNGDQRRARLTAGAALVWELARDTVHSVHIDGLVPVTVAAFDPMFRLVDSVVVDGSGVHRLPAGTAQVVVASLVPAESGAVGWSGASTLLLVNPYALLGEGVVVRQQAPVRVRRGSGSRSLGVLSGRSMADRNWTDGGAGRAPGWTLTTLPAAVDRAVVLLRPEDGGSITGGLSGAAEVTVLDPDPASARAAEPAPIRRRSVEDATGYLFVDLAGRRGARLLVQPGPGWRHDGVFGFYRTATGRPAINHPAPATEVRIS